MLLLTRDEIPHSVAVVVDSMKRDENDKVHVQEPLLWNGTVKKVSLLAKAEKC